MPYDTSFAGTVRVEPPLSAREREWVHALRGPQAAVEGRPLCRPGWASPWDTTTEGSLCISAGDTAPRQPAEWLAYLVAELHDPQGAAASGVLAGHACRGWLRAEGAVAGDRWELRVRPARLSVVRAGLPCPPCWRVVQLNVAPSAAYAFTHADGRGDDPAALLRPAPDHVEGDSPCAAGSWPATPNERTVRWPPRFMDWWHEHVPPPSLLDRLRA